MSLIVTGSISIDTIDTPTGSMKEVVGGSSIYFTAAASFFGPVRLIGAVGEDFPDSYVDVFHQFGVDVAGLERRAGSKTFRWHGRYHEDVNQRDTISVELNVLIEALPPIPESFKDSEYVFLAVTHPDNQLNCWMRSPSASSSSRIRSICTSTQPVSRCWKSSSGLTA